MRLLMLSVLVLASATASATYDKPLGDFGVGQQRTGLFAIERGGGEHERPRLFAAGLSTGAKYAINDGLWHIGMYAGVRIVDTFSMVAHGELYFGLTEFLFGGGFEVGPRWHFHYDRNEGAYLDVRWAMANYASGWWASSTGVYLGVGYEAGTDWVRGFFETGVRGMFIIRSGGSRLYSNQDLDRKGIEDIAGFQYYILRGGVRFYFGRG